MKRKSTGKKRPLAKRGSLAGPVAETWSRRASIFTNGSNQAVRLPQDLRFADDVREVRIRKLADGLLLSPVRPDWSSFFALDTEVPDDFLADRGDALPQSRAPL